MIEQIVTNQWLNANTPKSGKKPLFILRGFNENQLRTLNLENHLVDNNLNVDLMTLLDDLAVPNQGMNMFRKALAVFDNPVLEFAWLTAEEYLAVNSDSLNAFFECVVVNNNLYHKMFPIMYPIEGIQDIYQYGYLNDEDILDKAQLATLAKIDQVYGQINFNATDNQYYVTYNDNFDGMNTLDFYQIDTQLPFNPVISGDTPTVKIFDSEESVLAATYTLLGEPAVTNLSMGIATSEVLENDNFVARIKILIGLFAKQDTKLNVTILVRPKREIANEAEYLKLLKKQWEYDEFRNLKMYVDPAKGNKTTEISQIEIIDDIVQQAEIGLSGKQPRDIFITASTGAGKSVMFQLPAFYLSQKYPDIKPLTIVIQPLIGLMNDQVQSLHEKGVTSVETINSNIDPLKKQEIIEKIHNGDIDILFISTETLQNRSDIKQLIGDRQIGLFIVDEAHTVTTWGKTFRADYWYMGLYLTKLRKEYKFPIVTFTATAIIGGPLNMYIETVESLNLIEPIKYVGYVKRDDIFLNIEHKSDITSTNKNEYIKNKLNDLTTKISNFVDMGQKTLVYFPTVKELNTAFQKIQSTDPALADKIRKYYGPMNPAEKDITFNDFKDGTALVVFATKAFGMGIDIPDINNVYHYAPTGDVVDYIQEIGRVARDEKMSGMAGLLYLNNDLNMIKMLHGMSAVRKDQILSVMRKIVSMYHANGDNRNMVVSADDFQYVLQLSEKDDLDNKIKIILLMIEKDFEQGPLGYPPFVARPKPMFGNELVFIRSSRDVNQVLNDPRYGHYIKKIFDLQANEKGGYSAVYEFNMERLWREKFQSESNLSYPMLKAQIFTNDPKLDIGLRHFLDENIVFATGVDIKFSHTFSDARLRYKEVIDAFRAFLRNHAVGQNYFKLEDITSSFKRALNIRNTSEVSGLANAILNGSLQIAKENNNRFITALTGVQTGSYKVNNQYNQLLELLEQSLKRIFSGINRAVTQDHIHIFYLREYNNGAKTSQSKLAIDLAVLGIGEATTELTYEIKNGNNPQIYLRVNGLYGLEKALNNPDRYRNKLLEKVQGKHHYNVEFLKYLFTHQVTGKTFEEQVGKYTNWFWQEVEQFFLGNIPNSVQEALQSKKED